ncbi:endonuclease/exonuclease/phosphatase family protein [Candidatus Magnetominusculus dajiuhuensis]|uniref:endonuclease/exonuclease/phosphatase family protein n=1 Tax=Candidatus Magnetominusculus dajiuhuensis TaxID=3137712 RepID=UPI003B4360DA
MGDIELSVATWNISCGIYDDRGKDLDKGIHYISDCLKNVGADIIGLQEVLYSDGFSQADKIRILLGYDYKIEWPLSQSHILAGAKMGIAVLSKYPIKSHVKIDLPNPNLTINDGTTVTHDKGFICSTIDFNGSNILFVTGHMFPFHYFDRVESDFTYIFKCLEEQLIKNSILNMPSVICADFNTDDLKSLFPNVINGCKDMIHTPTRRDNRLHDHLLCNRYWNEHMVSIIPTLSDHHLCWAKIKLCYTFDKGCTDDFK